MWSLSVAAKQPDLEEFLDDDRGLEDADVPDDVEAELRDRLDHFRGEDVETELANEGGVEH